MSESKTQRPLQFQDSKTPTSPIAYPPGSAAKTKQFFNRVKAEADDDLDTMEEKLSAYHRDRATAARLDSLETFMQAQQAVRIQVSMQKQQADFLGQQAIFMQQALQPMGPTIIDEQTTDTQNTQRDDKQTKQTKQDKQTKDKQKTDDQRQEDQERTQLGVVGSSSSATAVGAWQDTTTLFVELEAACYLAQTEPSAYSCKDRKLTIDHYTNFLWCKEHDQAGAIGSLEQLHAEKLAGAAFEARVQKHMQALSHISNPSEHTKLMISLRCMHFSADVTTNSIAARVLRAYASAEPVRRSLWALRLHRDSWRHADSMRRDHHPQRNSRYAATHARIQPEVLRSRPL